jgi:hypothetical protein
MKNLLHQQGQDQIIRKTNKLTKNKILVIRRTNHNQTKDEWSKMHNVFP